FFEDRRIGSDPAQAVLHDQPFQFSAADQAPANVIEPDGLPETGEAPQRIRFFRNAQNWRCHFACYLSIAVNLHDLRPSTGEPPGRIWPQWRQSSRAVEDAALPATP